MTQKILLSLLCFIGLTHAGWGQVVYDSSAVDIRHLAPDHLASYQADEAFQYMENAEIDTGESLWDRLVNWVIQEIFIPLFVSAEGSGFRRVALAFLLAGFLIFVLSWILRTEIRTLFTGRQRTGHLALEISEENLDARDLDAEIEAALAQKAYRRAVRLHYLKALKHLSDQGRVRLRADKTNRDYEAEITDQGLRQQFRQITYIFNHIWYGDLPIDQQRFEGTRAAFVAFERVLEGAP